MLAFSARQRQLAMHAQCQQITRSCRPTACFKSSSRHPTRIQCQHVSNRQPSPPQPGLPDVTRRHLVPQKTWDKREQQHVQANRREVLSTSALVAAAALFISQPAEAAVSNNCSCCAASYTIAAPWTHPDAPPSPSSTTFAQARPGCAASTAPPMLPCITASTSWHTSSCIAHHHAAY